jgi:hypothetical protein
MALADVVQWVASKEGVRFVIYYLDDFLVIGVPDTLECAVALAKLLEILERLGLPVAVEKVERPLTQLGFLGFEIDSRIDSRVIEIRLLEKKLEEIAILLKEWQGRKACRKKELESLVGKLAFTARVVRPGIWAG